MFKTKLNKRIAVLLSCIMLITNCMAVLATPTGQEHWAKDYAMSLQSKGVVSSVDNLGAPITRIAFIEAINKVFGYQVEAKVDFKDVSKDSSYAKDIAKAIAAGYISGYEDGTVKPMGNITRQETMTILCRAFGFESKQSQGAVEFKDASKIGSWAQGAVATLAGKGVVKGDPNGNFRPQDNVSNGEAYKLIDMLAGVVVTKGQTYSKDVVGSVVVNGPGVTLKDMKIEGDLYLAAGIGDGDVHLNNVKVTGKTFVNGGGKNSIHVTNSTLLEVIVNKQDGTVRIVAHGDSKVVQVELQTSAILEEEGITGDGFLSVLLSKLLPTGANVALNGKFETVEVSASSINIDLPAGAIIDQLLANAAAHFSGTGTIMEVTDPNKNATIDNTVHIGGNKNTNNTTNNNDTGSGSGATTNFAFEISPYRGTGLVVAFNTSQVIEYDSHFTTAASIEVNVTIDGVPLVINESSYKAETKKLYLYSQDLYKDQNVGKTLQVQVKGKKALIGTYTQSTPFIGFTGQIHDVNNQGVADVTISLRQGLGNTTGPIVKTLKTDAEGQYGTFITPGTYVGELTKPGYISTNPLIATAATNKFNVNYSTVFIGVPLGGEMRTVLTWGEKPLDIDSHLFANLEDGTTYHTWFSDKEAKDSNGHLYADLDWDDVDSYGPETTTMRQMKPGTYSFYVHNFSEDPELKTSQAKVKVYGNSPTPVFEETIPTVGGNELYWHVYDMVVTTGGSYEIKSVNKLVDSMHPAYDSNQIEAIFPAAETTTPGVYEINEDRDLTNELILGLDDSNRDFICVDGNQQFVAVKAITTGSQLVVKTYSRDTHPEMFLNEDELEEIVVGYNEEIIFLPLTESYFTYYRITWDGGQSTDLYFFKDLDMSGRRMMSLRPVSKVYPTK